MGFTKQGLLHYFDSKEKLYSAILQRISDDFQNQQTRTKETSKKPIEHLKQFFASLAEPTDTNIRRVRLLVRELLDNNTRVKKTENWYLSGLLAHLIDMVKAIHTLQTLSDEDALLLAYQLLGAVNYFLISPATLTGFFGEDYFEKMSANFSTETNSLIDGRAHKHSEVSKTRIN